MIILSGMVKYVGHEIRSWLRQVENGCKRIPFTANAGTKPKINGAYEGLPERDAGSLRTMKENASRLAIHKY